MYGWLLFFNNITLRDVIVKSLRSMKIESSMQINKRFLFYFGFYFIFVYFFYIQNFILVLTLAFIVVFKPMCFKYFIKNT